MFIIIQDEIESWLLMDYDANDVTARQGHVILGLNIFQHLLPIEPKNLIVKLI